jgi:hypothetical protein
MHARTRRVSCNTYIQSKKRSAQIHPIRTECTSLSNVVVKHSGGAPLLTLTLLTLAPSWPQRVAEAAGAAGAAGAEMARQTVQAAPGSGRRRRPALPATGEGGATAGRAQEASAGEARPQSPPTSRAPEASLPMSEMAARATVPVGAAGSAVPGAEVGVGRPVGVEEARAPPVEGEVEAARLFAGGAPGMAEAPRPAPPVPRRVMGCQLRSVSSSTTKPRRLLPSTAPALPRPRPPRPPSSAQRLQRRSSPTRTCSALPLPLQ